MNQEDQKFFRQNFSADSFSDAEDENAPHYAHEKNLFKFKIPSLGQKESINILRKFKQSGDSESLQDSKNLISESRQNAVFVDSTKQNQLRLLQKFKAEIQGIKHFNNHSQPQNQQAANTHFYSVDDQHKLSSLKEKSRSIKIQSTDNKNHLKERRVSVKIQHSPREEERVLQQEYQYLQESRRLQSKRNKEEEKRLTDSVNEHIQIIQERENMIKRLRRNEKQLQDKYKNQIKQFQDQTENAFHTITSLRKELIQKQNQISDLKEKNRKLTSDTSVYKLQHQIELLRTREREYLETIKSLQTNSNNMNYSFAGSSINRQSSALTVEMTKLREAISERNQEWDRRLAETIQQDRKANIQQISKLFVSQNQPTFQQSQELRAELESNKSIVPSLDRLIAQIQELKQIPINNPIPAHFQDELQFIRQFIVKIYETKNYHVVQSLDNAFQRNNSGIFNQELDEYKRYVIEEQRNKKVFLEQLNLYKEQNQDIIKENAYLRHQLGTMELNLNKPNGSQVDMIESEDRQNIVGDLRQSVGDLERKVAEQGEYIKQLEGELMNAEPHKPIILHHPETSGTEGEVAQLHLEIQRLNHLLETQLAQLTEINEEKNRSYQQQIRFYEQRINIYQQTAQQTSQQLKQYESQVKQKSNFDPNYGVLNQTNMQLQQEVNALRGQLGNLTLANRELQRQIKQRSYAVDHLWQVKQAEFDNVRSIVNKIKVSSQF